MYRLFLFVLLGQRKRPENLDEFITPPIEANVFKFWVENAFGLTG